MRLGNGKRIVLVYRPPCIRLRKSKHVAATFAVHATLTLHLSIPRFRFNYACGNFSFVSPERPTPIRWAVPRTFPLLLQQQLVRRQRHLHLTSICQNGYNSVSGERLGNAEHGLTSAVWHRAATLQKMTAPFWQSLIWRTATGRKITNYSTYDWWTQGILYAVKKKLEIQSLDIILEQSHSWPLDSSMGLGNTEYVLTLVTWRAATLQIFDSSLLTASNLKNIA